MAYFKILLFPALLLFAVLTFSVRGQSVVNVELLPQTPGAAINPDFSGLSFEMRDVLAETNGSHFFSPDNKKLIATFKQLGIKNLRVGGNTADRATLPTPNAADVDSLFAFAKKADVKMIYTVRLKEGNSQAAIKMVAYIEQHYARQLDCFVIGNEPNTYYTNYPTYFADWKTYATLITAPTNSPEAQFCGPSVSPGHEKWSAQLATAIGSGGSLKFISQHDYPGGDARRATNATVARDKILSPDMAEHYASFASHFVPIVTSKGLSYRFEEANSYYDGGAPGASDTFASALWALDYEWWWANHGMIGINFHTGDKVAARDENKPCRYATFWTSSEGYHIHPIGYAEKMFSLGSHGRILPLKMTSKASSTLNITAYAILGDDKNFYVTLINKSHDATATNLSVIISAQGITGWSKGEAIRMIVPDGDVSRQTGVTVGGAEITDTGKWEGKWNPVMVPASGLQFPIQIDLPAASAVLIKLTPK